MNSPQPEYEGTWEELAMHEPEFRGCKLRLIVLPSNEPASTDSYLADQAPSARELLKLPLEERDRILERQAMKAEALYRHDPELTDFEAFGPVGNS